MMKSWELAYQDVRASRRKLNMKVKFNRSGYGGQEARRLYAITKNYEAKLLRLMLDKDT